MQCSIPGVPISHFLQKFILPVVVYRVFFFFILKRDMVTILNLLAPELFFFNFSTPSI